MSRRRPDRRLRREAAARAGEGITDEKRHACSCAGELLATSGMLRARALDDGSVDFDRLKQAESMAADAFCCRLRSRDPGPPVLVNELKDRHRLRVSRGYRPGINADWPGLRVPTRLNLFSLLRLARS